VPLGKGKALALSPDGQWALALRDGPPPQLVLLPVGAGETKTVKTVGFESFAEAGFFPDGKRVLFCGTESGHKPRLYVIDLENGTARPVSPEGVDLGGAELKFVSPDGTLAFAQDPSRRTLLYPIDGRTDSSPLPIAGLAEGEAPVGWTADSRSLFVMGPGEESPQVFRVNWTSGKRELYREFRPSDATGIGMSWVLVTPDGKGWVYSYFRRLSELYVVDGLK
jgi:Tol biopolymer transport system component